MPKVVLLHDEHAERAAVRRKILQCKLIERDWSPDDLIARLTMCRATWFKRKKNGDWLLEDIAEMDRYLRFTSDELVRMIRGK